MGRNQNFLKTATAAGSDQTAKLAAIPVVVDALIPSEWLSSECARYKIKAQLAEKLIISMQNLVSFPMPPLGLIWAEAIKLRNGLLLTLWRAVTFLTEEDYELFMVMDGTPEHSDDQFDAQIAREKANARPKRVSGAVSVAPEARSSQFSDATLNKLGMLATRTISKFHVLDWSKRAEKK